ncbi:hypothetical protein F5Y12DRAFT_461399 [Xylaria sp. FL1777]|nr:hypothetical protein F5Y12DRAFT_461399 [Xylaria sp. FL1777]
MSFTLMPFLYQTRTILRIPTTYRASARISRSLHATSRRPKETVIPFDYELEARHKESPDTESPEVANRGTITPSERQVFERIFADIEARGLKPATTDDDTSTPKSAASRSARLIMQQAAYDSGQARPSTVIAPGLLTGAAKDRAKALLRLPEPLRGATEKVLDTIKLQASRVKQSDVRATNPKEDGFADDDWKAPAHAFSRTLEIEALRFPERTRIEGLITSAVSDFELWDILEKEVFTMPERLGIMNSSANSPKRTYRSRKYSQLTHESRNDEGTSLGTSEIENTSAESSIDEPTGPGASEVENSSATTNNVSSPGHSQKLSLYVHGPLYPAYLLLALRRLDTAFSTPSSLVFSILPRIKELSLESYILGVSTPFFNELLAICWGRRGDLSAMLDLLEEMRHCGLYFDKHTTSTITQADTLLSGLSTPEGGSGFGRALMMMPEYEHSQRARLRHWHRLVDLSVRERQDDHTYDEAVHGH